MPENVSSLLNGVTPSARTPAWLRTTSYAASWLISLNLVQRMATPSDVRSLSLHQRGKRDADLQAGVETVATVLGRGGIRDASQRSPQGDDKDATERVTEIVQGGHDSTWP